MIIEISGRKIHKVYDLTKPQGVCGRNADLSLIRKVLGWCPKTSYKDGLTKTYKWFEFRIYNLDEEMVGKDRNYRYFLRFIDKSSLN